MKKFFLFAAAVASALTINANVIDFATVAAESDFSLKGFTKNDKESKDTKLVYDLKAETEGEATFTNLPVVISVAAPKDDKAKYFTINLATYVEMGGKGFELKVTEAKADATVELLVANKSEKGDGELSAVSGLEGNPVALPKRDKNKANTGDYDKDGYCWVKAQFKATDIEFVITETMYGFRVKSIDLDAATAVENVFDGVKAVKTFENGQLVIIKNGVRYNALGAQL